MSATQEQSNTLLLEESLIYMWRRRSPVAIRNSLIKLLKSLKEHPGAIPDIERVLRVVEKTIQEDKENNKMQCPICACRDLRRKGVLDIYKCKGCGREGKL